MADLALETTLPLLLKAARSGDLAAFEQILIRYQRPVFATALRLLGNREDAQDAAQEVFLRVHRYLSRFDDVRAFSPWLYRVTVNVCHDMRRRGRETVALEDDFPAAGGDPQAGISAAERRRILESALARLPEKERAAIVLRDIEGLSTREVARIVGTAESTVRSQIASARLKLAKYTERFRRGRE